MKEESKISNDEGNGRYLRQGARVTWTDFGPVPSFLKQLGSNFLGNLPVYMTWLKTNSSR